MASQSATGAANVTSAAATTANGVIKFGPFEVTSQVFLTTQQSFALVNIKPLKDGHVLVCPLEQHRRLTDLSTTQLADLFATVQRVQRALARRYFEPLLESSESSGSIAVPPAAGSFNIAIQDGADAGQTVAHTHIHVIPRPRVDDEALRGPPGTQGEAMYEGIAAEVGNVGGGLWDAALGARPKPGGSFVTVDDMSRPLRTMEEMAAEAAEYRQILDEMEKEG